MTDEYQNADEFVEVDVDLRYYQFEILRRLVEEGRFESMSEAASWALEDFGDDEASDYDPVLEDRITRLEEIGVEVESRAIGEFMNDTTYLMIEYGKTLNEEGETERLRELDIFLSALDEIICPPRDPEYVDELFVSLREYVDDFDEMTPEDDTRSAVVENYRDRYSLDDMKMLLTS